MFKVFSPENSDDGVRNCLGETPYEPFLIVRLPCSFDMLIAVEYGMRRDFKRSVCNYHDTWNRHHKSDGDDIGLREAFRRVCVKMYRWALEMFQTLPNYLGQRAIICYSFVCLADGIGQFLRTNHPDRSPISAGMRTRTLRCAVPAMQELEGEQKDFIGAAHYLMTIFESVQRQQTVKGVLPHTEVESERYIAEQRTILKALQEHGDMRTSVKGYPSPVSLKEGRTLVLPLDLYDALYAPCLMAPPARADSSRKEAHSKDEDSSAQLAPFVTPAPATGGSATMKRMDNRVASFAETQEGSATEWELEEDDVVKPTKPIKGMRPAGMSDEDWNEEDLNLGCHPTSEVADEPPEMGDKQIEGARGVPPLEGNRQETTDVPTGTTDEVAQYPSADEIMAAEMQYGNLEAENQVEGAEADDTDGNDYDVVIEETYYEHGEEDLDYNDVTPEDEDAPDQVDDQELDEDVNADDDEEDDHAGTTSEDTWNDTKGHTWTVPEDNTEGHATVKS